MEVPLYHAPITISPNHRTKIPARSTNFPLNVAGIVGQSFDGPLKNSIPPAVTKIVSSLFAPVIDGFHAKA
jgi:hypothetical protein